MISTSLLNHQYVSFRFDKRGVGRSYIPSLSESDLTIDVYVKDVHSIIQTLSDVNGFRIFNLIGHSEGGLIALLVAQTTCINSLVLIATPALLLLKTSSSNINYAHHNIPNKLKLSLSP
ncbi:alpha/beta hydrolase [Enterovibrio gelatinilyticus]|uniref:alpha/beta hydrolase n=1 Tax=Enterovibrio gelatinilyticus TaxID=2899819 RepID=UPI003B66F316